VEGQSKAVKSATERNAARLMRKAAKVMQDKEWIRRVQLGDNGEMCILGALNYTYCGNAKPLRHNPLVIVANNTFTNWYGESIPMFNDKVAKDKQEIIDTMLKFANEYDPQGDANG